MCLFVVVWHEKTIGSTAFVFDGTHGWADLNLADIFYFNITLLAVPTFLAMSGWLVAERIGDPSHLFKRIIRFGALYIFWSALYSLVFRVPLLCPEVSVGCYVKKILTGNYAYDTYYLLVLMIQDCTLALLVTAGRTWGRRLSWMLVAAFVTTSALGLLGLSTSLSAFYSPVSFAAIPAAVYAVRCDGRRFAALGAVTLLPALSVLFAAGEWTIYLEHATATAFPNYARPSVVVGAMALVALCQRTAGAPGTFIRHMSDVTLGVYLVHPFVIVLLEQDGFRLRQPFMTAVVLGISYGAVLVLRPLMRQRLI